MKDCSTISYNFSDSELMQLALYLRKNANIIPKDLENLAAFSESYVYGKMSIGEAEAFFSS